VKVTTDCNWIDGMAFEAIMDGHKLVIDAAPDVGGEDRGPRPKPLMLLSLAGCTGMDVIYILKKMKQTPSWFNVKVEAEQTEEHPKHYAQMSVIYQFKKGDDLDPKKVERAVTLSQERYCGVSALLGKAAQLDHRIEYLQDTVTSTSADSG